MYANEVRVRISDMDSALKGLHEEVLPRVRQAPGIVAGYWLEPRDGQGLSIAVFDSEESARSAAQMVQPGTSPTTGVTIESVETRKVVGNI